MKLKRIISSMMILLLVLCMCACEIVEEKPSDRPEATAAPTPSQQLTPSDDGEDMSEPGGEDAGGDTAEGNGENNGTAEQEDKDGGSIVIAISQPEGKFSPFFSTKASDIDIMSMVNARLLANDRGGAIVTDGINGTVTSFNGSEYTYYGIGNAEVTVNDDGTADYRLSMRDDIYFSDGKKANIDDVIFSLYVFCDPTYDGLSTYYALPIEGAAEYRNSMAELGSLIFEAGRDNTDFSKWSEESQNLYWTRFDGAGAAFARNIIDYCLEKYNDDTYVKDYFDTTLTYTEVCADPVLQVGYGMALWGFGKDWFEGATEKDYWEAILRAYGNDLKAANDSETVGASFYDLFENYYEEYGVYINKSESVDCIKGIERIDDYSMVLHMTNYDATTEYSLNFAVIPLHYYGNPELYDYDNHSYGLVKGDLSGVHKKDGMPLGCGPYRFMSYENGDVCLEANQFYFLGKPEIGTLIFREAEDGDYVNGVAGGLFDIAAPALNDDVLDAIREINGGTVSGDVITTYEVDYPGYGYLGINADLVNVGGEPGSEASKNLRKALMTVLAVYRDDMIKDYYGERASVIEYPISNTSWAAPRPSDADYRKAYSTDVGGNPVYTDSMGSEERYDAALQAAMGYFEAAGFIWNRQTNSFVKVPEGAKLSYTIIIPGSGMQNHPAYAIARAAADKLATIGVELIVEDVTSAVWDNSISENTAEIWAGGWRATVDPDMYQIYHSSDSTHSNHYRIADEKLDELIMTARRSTDKEFRKNVYKEAMEIILDWGAELPLYQKKDCMIVSSERVDTSTIPDDMTPYRTIFAEIEKMKLRTDANGIR